MVETFRTSAPWVNVNTQDYYVLPPLVPLNLGYSVELISHPLSRCGHSLEIQGQAEIPGL